MFFYSTARLLCATLFALGLALTMGIAAAEAQQPSATAVATAVRVTLRNRSDRVRTSVSTVCQRARRPPVSARSDRDG